MSCIQINPNTQSRYRHQLNNATRAELPRCAPGARGTLSVTPCLASLEELHVGAHAQKSRSVEVTKPNILLPSPTPPPLSTTQKINAIYLNSKT